MEEKRDGQECTTAAEEATYLLQQQPRNNEKTTSLLGTATRGTLLHVKSIGILACMALLGGWFLLYTSPRNTGRLPAVGLVHQDAHIEESCGFPEGFVWGSATSSYQVEGAVDEDGRGPSIWDHFCHSEPSRILDGGNGDVACDHYHRFRSDVQLMKVGLGLKAYRFSVAWSRIIPDGTGEINPLGIAFYNELIDALLEEGIAPWVTLYHWDLPLALEVENGGWLGGQATIDAFGNYARACFDAFGDRVKHWITINEPWTVAIMGYNNGVHAPGKSNRPTTDPYIVGHHLLLAHGRAATIYRDEFAAEQRGVVGISNSGDYRFPRTQTSDDKAAAERSIIFQLGWFMDPIWRGEYPLEMRERLGKRLPRFTAEESAELRRSSDFAGINHYSSLLASKPIEEPTYGGYWADIHVDLTDDPSWKQNVMGWNIVPNGCREILIWIRKRYDGPVIYITENGSAFDERQAPNALNDVDRRDFFKAYLAASLEAIHDGVDLRGYFAWSFMDNFEWQFGFERRFGLYRVEYDSQARLPKLSAKWFRETIRSNGRNIPRPLR